MVGRAQVAGLEGRDANVAPSLLVVEDDQNVRDAMARMLERVGYSVTGASSLAEARGLLVGHKDDFTAAVVDYGLPDGCGLDLVEQLVSRTPICRSVVVTGAVGSEPATESVRVGAHAYVRKPVDVPTLLDAVRRTLQSTKEWRDYLSQAEGARGRGSSFAPPPVAFDITGAVARLKHIGRLTPVHTITAWRLLWGDSNRDLAEVLGVSERTAKYHVAEVLTRTGARTRSGLLRLLLFDAGIDDPWVRVDERPSTDEPAE